MFLARIKSLIERRGFGLLDRPYELNIVGLRSKSNQYNDEIHVFFKTDSRKWNYHVFPGITDLGKVFSPPFETISLKEGQYKNSFKLMQPVSGMFALVQVKPVKIEFPNKEEEKGIYGITVQLMDKTFRTENPYAVASQLFLDSNDFNQFKNLCEDHVKLYGNKFTYTLIEFRKGKKTTMDGFTKASNFITSLFRFLFERKRK